MSRTILLADDSVTIQKVVELTFLDEDFRVVSVGDGAEAIARLGELRPDLVIADVHMPGADGYEVAEAARRELPGAPVLLLVGTFEVFDAERAGRAGASGHLKKPFDSQEMLRRVKELFTAGAAPAPAPPSPIVPAGPRETLAVPTLGGQFWEGTAGLPALEDVPAEPAAAPIPEIDTAVDLPDYLPEEEAAAAFATPSPPTSTPSPLASSPQSAPVNGDNGDKGSLSDQEVERIARRVAELIGDKVVRDVAWEVVPDLAEVLLKARIRELESSVE
jgi:CheY-like chemotaxis protein